MLLHHEYDDDDDDDDNDDDDEARLVCFFSHYIILYSCNVLHDVRCSVFTQSWCSLFIVFFFVFTVFLLF